MKKFLILLISFFIVGNVYAASANINLSASASTVIVGNTVTVTVKTTSTSSLGGVEYTVSYDSSMLSLTKTTSPTGGARTVGYHDTKGHTTLTYTYTFKALKSGNTKVSIIGGEASDDEGKSLSVSSNSVSIKIMTQKELEATYSSNNNLSSLSIEGYDIEPAFNKDTLEYTVKLKPETESININASKEDYRSSIIGAGNVLVSEGANTIKIDVVAQNGNIKSYIINAIVEEYDPINVTVDNINYTVVRSRKIQTFNNQLFKEDTINIKEYEVPSFYNELTNTNLVALKDEEGQISYFIYDDGKYTKFNELNLNGIDLMIIEPNELIKGFNLSYMEFNDIKYPIYKNKDTSRFGIIYGTNLVNNNTSYYMYDNLENTLQRFDIDLYNELNNNLSKSSMIIYVLIGLSTILTAGFITYVIIKRK